MTDENLRDMRDDLHTVRDLLFMVLLAPFVIVALLIKLLVQILFFTGITFLKTCLKWDGSTWRQYRDGISSRDEVFEGEIKRLRFRPWVDPHEEDKE